MAECDDPLRNLSVLRYKLDTRSAEITLRRAAHFACRIGCDGCCQTERTVSDIEYAALEQAVADLPETSRLRLREQIQRRETDDGPCGLLMDGRCAVYEERPLICRSHGLPMVMEQQLSVCPLNFTEMDIADLPNEDLISVDTLTAILVAVNALYCQETGGDAARRRPVSQLLDPSESSHPKRRSL